MARQTTKQRASSNGSSPLQESIQRLASSMTDRAVSSMSDRLTGATGRLTDYAQNGGGGLLSAVTGLDDVSSPVKSALLRSQRMNDTPVKSVKRKSVPLSGQSSKRAPRIFA